MAVFNFGSINIDHVYSVSHFVQPGETLSSSAYQSILGGKGANQSVALAKAENNIYHVGAIGSSDSAFIEQMEKAGVNCTHIRALSDVASGHAIIQVTPDAENAIILFGGANHCLSDDHIASALAFAKTDDWVLLQNETNAIADIIESSHARGLNIAFNPAPMTASVKSLPLDKLSLLIVNEVEAEQLTGESDVEKIKQSLLANYPSTQFVVTLGKQGAWYVSAEDQHYCPAFKVDAVDTTAAGDTFIGFFLAAYQRKESMPDALKYASAASALAVTKAGAAPSIPNVDEVAAFLQKNN
ncbi:ribokinase [Glaciecola sp. MH2013]|uniref:ribokinase n=1 Tax=Glaciecola sp. MH2013 TaxID=2785524 RepID=UPI00189F9E5C|nr:ribokinase [Glaciecola sp. MH2013]MBF7072080.1 ribokinase [Glaciecola sp. MH2013]